MTAETQQLFSQFVEIVGSDHATKECFYGYLVGISLMEDMLEMEHIVETVNEVFPA